MPDATNFKSRMNTACSYTGEPTCIVGVAGHVDFLTMTEESGQAKL